MAKVRLLCGPAKSARAELIDNLTRAHWGRALLLAPTQQMATARTEQLILDGDSPGWWGRPVMTYNLFVARLLQLEGHDPVRLSDFERQLLLERALPDGPSAGYYVQMLRVITQLKQAAIEPAEFKECMARAGLSKNDSMVAEAYEAYQRALLDAGLYDLPGLFWDADVVCRDRRPRILDDVDVLLLDGFDDFTPSEFKLLLSLEKHLDLMVFGLECSDKPSQKDLYRLPLRTAGKIEKAFDSAIEYFAGPAAETCIDFAADNMFWRDEPIVPPKLAPNLDIIPCADSIQEVEIVARHVKSLLLDGVPAARIAVVYRSLDGVAGCIRATFAECGIPFFIKHSPPLWESAVCCFVYNLLDATEKWEREPIADLLSSPWLRPGEPDVSAASYLACFAGIVAGQDEWHTRIRVLQGNLPALKRIERPAEALDAVLARLDTLERLAARVPEQGTATQFIDALMRIIEDPDLKTAMQQHPESGARQFEESAVCALRGMLIAWQKWEESDTARLGRGDFLQRFRRALQSASFELEQPRDGVLCTDCASLRHLRYDYIFFCGVNEGEVPKPPPRNAVYSEQDIARLARLGIELDSRRAHVERESLLFHHVLTAAKKRLMITWRRFDERSREQSPSPYVQDVLDLLRGMSVESPMPMSTAFVPEFAEAASERDVRNRAFMENSPTAHGIIKYFPKFEAVTHGVMIEISRDGFVPFDCYDAVLTDAQLVHEIAAEYGPEHLFSVNQIETYLRCPFQFYATRLLRLDPGAVPMVEIDPATRGKLLHEVLEQFFQEWRKPVADLTDADVRAALPRIVSEVFGRNAGDLQGLPPSVLGVERQRAETLIARHLLIEREKGSDWTPAQFERTFGFEDPPFTLATGEGPVLLRGRIDRIDTSADEDCVRIVDYKSSRSVKPKDITEGRSIQLAIYAMAMESLLMPDAQCREAWFATIGKDEWVEALHRDAKKSGWEERRAVTLTAVERALRDIRAGKFPPTPAGKCDWCEAKQACRYNKGRIQRKTATDESDTGSEESD